VRVGGAAGSRCAWSRSEGLHDHEDLLVRWQRKVFVIMFDECLMARRTAFRKSSYSSAGNCVEVGSPTSRLFAVRDTKDRGGPWVSFSVAGWREFVGQIKADVVVTPGLLLGCGGSAKAGNVCRSEGYGLSGDPQYGISQHNECCPVHHARIAFIRFDSLFIVELELPSVATRGRRRCRGCELLAQR
jgi:hypothetical protein